MGTLTKKDRHNTDHRQHTRHQHIRHQHVAVNLFASEHGEYRCKNLEVCKRKRTFSPANKESTGVRTTEVCVKNEAREASVNKRPMFCSPCAVRDPLLCQKRPTTVSKREASVNKRPMFCSPCAVRDPLLCQKRPTTVSKREASVNKRPMFCSPCAPNVYLHT
jgi:hypothetical protein